MKTPSDGDVPRSDAHAARHGDALRTQSEGRRALLEDMHRALLAEFGAQAIYTHLASKIAPGDLRELVIELHAQQAAQIERLRDAMRALGAAPPTRSRRRRVLAWALAAVSGLTGRRLVLRICAEAEGTASRWYARFAEYLAATGERELARSLSEMSRYKLSRSQSLQAWLGLRRDQVP